MIKETILLTDLNCPSCAADLEKAFRGMPGVKKADVAFGTGTLQLEYATDEVAPEKVEKTIKSFGVGIASRM